MRYEPHISVLPLLAGLLLLSTPARGGPPDDQLDFLAGDWTITDPTGHIGHSHIVVQAPEAMLFEMRDVPGQGALPLWFARTERNHGWVQLFPSPAGLREFALLSPPGSWPMVFGGDVTLQDGSHARFRLTMSRTSADESRRLLEVSRDGGTSWSRVFDYLYRRAPGARP